MRKSGRACLSTSGEGTSVVAAVAVAADELVGVVAAVVASDLLNSF